MLAVAAVVHLASCTPDTCLAGDGPCEEVGACRALNGVFSCQTPRLSIGRVADLGIDLEGAQGVGGDIVMTNGVVTAVINQLDSGGEIAPGRGLAPTGGSIIDLGPAGGGDDIDYMHQLSGVLPDDTFAYESLRIIDEAPEYVAVIARGELDGRDDLELVTRYELRPCEPGLRVRSEVYNGSADVLPLILADMSHWGKRNALPFAALPGQGFLAPELDLLELQDAYFEHEYVLARAPTDDAPTYGFVACDGGTFFGVNDPEVSALGTDIELVRPGESLMLERLITATAGRDLGSGLAAVNRVRGALGEEPATIAVTGRLMAGGAPLAGSVRRGVLLIGADEVGGFRPLVTAVAGDDGSIAVEVEAAETLRWELWSFGRPVAGGTTSGLVDIDLGALEIEMPARVDMSIAGAGSPLIGAVIATPADGATRDAVTGTWFGRLGECAPWLGPPVSGSPACNRVLVPEAGASVEFPAGRYLLVATAGPSRTLAEVVVDLEPGAAADVDFVLALLPVVPPGWVSADLHVHGAASFDSSIPDLDRVMTFAAHDVQVVVATDHDYIVDYAEAVAAAGLEDRVAVIGGLETTPLIPFLDVPGEELPRVIGHFNHWPLAPRPAEPRAGAPFDERIEPGALFDLLDPRMGLDVGIHMLNHPWDETVFGRDLGYLRAIGFDPRVPIPEVDDGSNNGVLMRGLPGGKRNIDFDLVELQNGGTLTQVLKTRPLWFSLLSQGFVRVAGASSDSHSMSDAQLGYGRTWVDIDRDFSLFDPVLFNFRLKEGRAVGGNGAFILAALGTGAGDRRGPRLEPYVPSGGDTLEIEVRAAPWIPVTEIRLVTSSGARVLASGDELTHPASPLAAGPVVRYRATVPLDQIVSGRDDWFIIEAGLPLFQAADLDDDGVPDTTDNNGDGVIDAADIADPEDDSGPLASPADPSDRADPRYYMTRVVPGGWPYSFTNPFFVDLAGDGWDAPGL